MKVASNYFEFSAFLFLFLQEEIAGQQEYRKTSRYLSFVQHRVTFICVCVCVIIKDAKCVCVSCLLPGNLNDAAAESAKQSTK